MANLWKPDPNSRFLQRLRRALLAEPGVTLHDTQVVRRRRRERWDLLSYRQPGGPRRRTWIVATWAGAVWSADDFMTAGEASAHFATGGRVAPWMRLPPQLADAGGDRA